MEWNEMGRSEYSFIFIFLKSQIFIPLKLGGMSLKLGGMRGNKIRFNNFLLKLSKYPYIFNPLF